MIGKLRELLWLRGGEWVVSFTTREDPSSLFNELKDAAVHIEIKKAANRRSRDANAFAWVLIDKIAEKTRVPKTEVYRQAIREIGGVSELVCIKEKAADRLCEGWQKNGIGWQAEQMPSKLPGCVNVLLYYGSSTYDTAQMSRLLDLLIQEAEQQGIPTLRDEAEKLLKKWK